MKEQLSESPTVFENKQIDVTFTNPENQKEEKYKLLNEEKESLLIKEDLMSNNIGNYQVRISELFNNERNEQYYLNKEKSKEKYLKNLLQIEQKDEDIVFNNKDQNEMDALYRETCLKHPRKLVDGEIQKYPFRSWTGCFTCQKCAKIEKNEFIQLGFGISSYFKTIKLFIFFFLIISVINLLAVMHYSKYKSTIKEDNFFFKTTLGNTKITTYNSKHYTFSNNFPLELDCSNKTIGKIIYGFEVKDPSKIEEVFNENELSFKDKGKTEVRRMSNARIKYYNERLVKTCNLTNRCSVPIDNRVRERIELYEHDYLYYECIDMSLVPENTSQNALKKISNLTGLLTLVILILLYYYYRIAINIDNKYYHKDKITINNYTLVLRGLKKSTNDFFKELNDLVNHLNTIISKEKESNNLAFDQDLTYLHNNDYNNYNEKVKFNNLNIFDISLSSVNEKKMSIIEKIKTLKDEISDLKEGNDTIQKKIKNKIFTAVGTVTSLYNQIKNKNKEEVEEEENTQEALVDNTKEDINQEKIDKTKNKLKKQITKVYKSEIQGLHMDSDKKKYVDIYITFRNPSIANFIYQSYDKGFFQRVLLFLFCKIRTIRLYYYKRQWLSFYLSSNAPTNIIWENCYLSTKSKWCRRIFTFFISIFTIVIATVLIYIFTAVQENTSSTVNSYIITGILKVISIASSMLLEKLTSCEKNSNLTKNITSDIEKYFFLNFAVSTISVNLRNYYTYQSFEEQYPIIMSSILQSMMLSIVTEHLSTLAKYLFNFLKRYLDSDFENGKKTKLKKKMEYEELYIGPEFPIGERLSGIFVNLGLCLLYGTSCPLIYLFFALYLLTTFIVDKLLVIHYYKKPPYYDNYFAVFSQKVLFLSIIVYIYGSIYYISNPYLFNYFQNDSLDFGFKVDYYIVLNPITIIFSVMAYFSKISITIFNRTDLASNYKLLMLLFILPIILINIYEICKKKDKKKVSLQNTPNVDIGIVYSLDELNKYYEVKKLELFKFLLNFDKKSKEFKKYSNLADSYKNELDYLKQNIEFKKSILYKNKDNNKNIIDSNNIISTNSNLINTNTDSNGLLIKDKDEFKNDRLLLGDPSFNLAFISNYEIYAYFDLLYCV